jgi:hypothetical protein
MATFELLAETLSQVLKFIGRQRYFNKVLTDSINFSLTANMATFGM